MLSFLPIEVKKILKIIDVSEFNRSDFGIDWIEHDYINDNAWRLKKKQIDVEYGISKLVFIPWNYDFVIKIPFLGKIRNTYDFEEPDNPNSDYIYSWQDYKEAFYPLTSSSGGDYCRSEAEYYQLAKEAGFEDMFCKTEFFGDVDGVPIYVSEKARGSEGIRFISDEEKETITKLLNKFHIEHYFSAGFINAMMNKHYSEEYIAGFLKFLIHNSIGDLHSDNFGVRRDGTPVIIDYSDFND